jgi:hypothetical protein
MYHGYAFNPSTGLPAEYEELANNPLTGPKWRKSNADEIYQPTTGRDNVPGTNTMAFCYQHEVPTTKTATYIRIVCADCPEKEIAERLRWTVGGDRVQYDGNTNTETADLISVKTHQQHHQYAKRTRSLFRPQGFLPRDTNGRARIYTSSSYHDPGRSYGLSQSGRQSRLHKKTANISTPEWTKGCTAYRRPENWQTII